MTAESMCQYDGERDQVLVAYLYEEIDAAERARFDAHLQTCAQCRGELSALRALRPALREWTPPEPASLPPILAIAEFTPISSPFIFTRAPPELPGLIAASVWMASSTVTSPPEPSPAATGRSSALTMPVVTVPCRPSGEPIATTC